MRAFTDILNFICIDTRFFPYEINNEINTPPKFSISEPRAVTRAELQFKSESKNLPQHQHFIASPLL